MAENTRVDWADHTFNYWWGCQKATLPGTDTIDPACWHCYAERDAKRYGKDVWGPSKPRIVGDGVWKLAHRLNKEAGQRGIRYSIFTNSMSDLLEEAHRVEAFSGGPHPKYKTTADVRRDVWDTVEQTPNLVHLFLTKRPENALSMMPAHWLNLGAPPNVILGTTAAHPLALRRVFHLLKAAAALRVRTFVSVEPMTCPIDLCSARDGAHVIDLLAGVCHTPGAVQARRGPKIDQVIVGGESGPRARPMHPAWPREIRDACAHARTPFHFKQWGEWLEINDAIRVGHLIPGDAGQYLVAHDGEYTNENRPHAGKWADRRDGGGNRCCVMVRVPKKLAGRTLDGRTHDELIWPVGQAGPKVAA